jgi:hypothetical protein
MPSVACSASDSPALEIGLVEAVISQSLISIERELGDSESLCWGTETAADIMNWVKFGTQASAKALLVCAVVDVEQIELCGCEVSSEFSKNFPLSA